MSTSEKKPKVYKDEWFAKEQAGKMLQKSLNVQQLKQRPRQIKKRIEGMLPVKEWLSLDEACAYMDLCKNIFMEMAVEKNLTISQPTGKKKFFRVQELKKVFENSITIKQVIRNY